MPPMPPVTQALLIANVAIFVVDQFLLGGMLSQWFALWPLGSNFQPYQVATDAFLHGSMMHLFFNMLGLWMFGSVLERGWGGKRYLQFYAASLLAPAGMQLVVNMLIGSPYPTVGASGALFGMLLAFGMMFPNRTIMPLFPRGWGRAGRRCEDQHLAGHGRCNEAGHARPNRHQPLLAASFTFAPVAAPVAQAFDSEFIFTPIDKEPCA